MKRTDQDFNRKRSKHSILAKTLALFALTAPNALALQDFEVLDSDISFESFRTPEHVRQVLDSTEYELVSGFDFSLEAQKVQDLTVMVSFKSNLEKDQLQAKTDDSVVVDIPDTLSCFIQGGSADFSCRVDETIFTISSEEITSYSEWTQLTLSLESDNGFLELESQSYSASSIQVLKSEIALGASALIGHGFDGSLSGLEILTNSSEIELPRTWFDLLKDIFTDEPVDFKTLNKIISQYSNQAFTDFVGINVEEAKENNLYVLDQIIALFGESSALSSVDTISELVDTIVTFQVYDELLDIEVASKITEVLNLLEVLGQPYELYRRDFESLQKIIDLTGRMIAFIDDESALNMMDGRMLQQATSSLESLRDLMKLILKVKTSQADQKCSQPETTSWTGNQSHFELHVLKIPLGLDEFVPEESTFTHNLSNLQFSGQVMDINVPTRELSVQSLVRNPLATWFCLQVTFFKVNPKLLVTEAPNEYEFVDESRIIVTVESLDSTGYRLLAENTVRGDRQVRGIHQLQNDFNLNYPFDFPFGADQSNFDERNVACAYFWSYTKVVGEGIWSMDGCTTKFDFFNNKVRCHCEGISHVYYKLMKHIYADPALTAPVFDLYKNSSPVEYVFAHMENSWQIDMNGASLLSPNVLTEVTVSPEEIFDQNKLILNKETGIFNIEADALQVDTLYSIEVRIRNSTLNEFNQLFTNETTQRIDFKTERPPFGGIFNVSPDQGFAQDTLVKVTITNWESKHYPLTIELFGNYRSLDNGILSHDAQFDINFTNKKIIADTQIWEIETLLPEAHNIQAHIKDYFGQVTVVNSGIDIIRAPLTWQELIDEAFSLRTYENKFTELRSLVYEYNRQAKLNGIAAENVPTDIIISEATAFNMQICDRVRAIMSSGQWQDYFVDVLSLDPSITGLIDLFGAIAREEQALTLEIVECIIDGLYNVERMRTQFYNYQKSLERTERLLTLTNDLFSYMHDMSINLVMFIESDFERFSPERQVNMRSLDTMVILSRRLHKFKSAMIDDQCRIQDYSLYNKQSHFELLLLRIPANTPERQQYFVNKEDYSYLRVPITEILLEAEEINWDVDSDVEWICLGVTFYNLNPYLLTPQTDGFRYASGSDLITTTEAVDSAGHRVLGAHSISHTGNIQGALKTGIHDLVDPFMLSYTYNYPFGANVRNFDMRNATCSYFQLDSDLNGEWSYEGCETIFHFNNNTIQCLCEDMSDALYQIMSPTFDDPEITAPIFEIEKMNNPVEHVVASKASTFAPVLQLDQWQMIYPSALTYEYNFRPGNALDWDKVSFDENSGTIEVEPLGFLKDYTYVLEIKITNSTVSRFGRVFTASTTEYYNFTTVAAPYGGVFNVSPYSGYEDYTIFDIELYGWADRYYPLLVELQGHYYSNMTEDPFDTEFKQKIVITENGDNNRRYILDDEQVWIYSTELPIIHYVEARLTNALGENIILQDRVNITKAPLTWQELIDQAFGLYKVQDRFADLIPVVREYCRQSVLNAQGFREVPTNVTIAEATGYNLQIINKIYSYITADSSSPVYEMLRSRQAVINLVDLMDALAHCEESQNYETITKMIAIMNRFDSLDFTYVVYQQENVNVEKLLDLTNHMFTWLNRKSYDVETQYPYFQRDFNWDWFRMFNNTNIQTLRDLTYQVLEFKTKLADNQCQIRREPVHSNHTHFEMQVIRVLTNSTKDQRFFIHSDDLAYMTVPQSELIAETLSLNPDASYLCFQTTFYNLNPRLLTVETDKYKYVDGTQLISQVETLDSEGYRLLGHNNFGGSQWRHGIPKLYTQFNLLFKYDFPEGANKYNFDERNVSCSQYTDSGANQVGNWAYQDCQTEYYFKDRGIMCLCNSIGDSFYQLTQPSYEDPSLDAPRVEIIKSTGLTNIVVASQQNNFLLNLQNGMWTDSNVDYNLTVSPEFAVDTSLMSLDKTLGKLVFEENALMKGQSYSIKLEVRNHTYSRFGKLFEKYTTKYYNFTTVSAPTGGEFFVTPGECGFEYETDITMNVRGWQSYHYPLTLTIYGEYQAARTLDMDDEDESFVIPLLSNTIREGQIWQETKRMRSMHQLRARITDNVGEFTEVYVDCNITQAPLTWQELIDLAFSQDKVEDKFHELKMVVNEYNLQAIMNNEGSSGVPTDIILSEALAFNLQVIERTNLLLNKPQFSPTFLAMNSVQSVSNIVDFLDTLAAQIQATSLEINCKIIDALHLVKNLGITYVNYQQSPFAVERLLHCSDAVISYLDKSIGAYSLSELKKCFRRVVEFKKDVADTQCRLISREMQNWQSKFELQIYKMPATSVNADREIFFSYSKDLSRMTVPQKELISETRTRNPDATWICFQATFYSVNQALILDEDRDFQFVDGARLVSTIETVDSTGFHLLSDHLFIDRSMGYAIKGVDNLQDQFIQTFKYEFPPYANSMNFDMRNVSCSYFSHEHPNYNRGYWSYEGCETFYYFSSNEIYCRCNSVSDAYYTLMRPTFQDPEIMAPEFTINKISSPYDYVIAGKTSQFHVDLLRGRLSDSNLYFSMRIYPENFVNHNGYTINEDTGVITIQPDTLQKGMTYTIQVTVYNTTVDIFGTDFTAEATRFYEFSTVTPPTGGNFVVNPYDGVEYDTSFTIQIDSWESEFYPLTVDLKGEYYSFKTDDPNDRDHLHDIGLATDKIYKKDDIWRLQTKLPAMHLIKLILRDAAGETTQVTRPVNITKTPLTWQQKIDLAFAEPTVVKKYQNLRQVVSAYNSQAIRNMRGERDVPTDVNIAEAIAFNKQCVRRTRGIEIISSESASIQDQIATVSALDAMILFLDTIGGPDYYDETLDLELAQLIIDALNDIETYEVPYQIWQDDEYNLSLMLDLTNNLIGIIDDSVSLLFFRRNLQQSGSINEQEELLSKYSSLLRRAVQINQVALDDQCQSQSGHFWSKKEAHFELLNLKLPVDSTIEDHEFVFTEDETTRAYVPTKEIIAENLAENPDAEFICFQVSFYKVYPDLMASESGHFVFTENNVPYVRMQTLDSTGYRLLSNSNEDFEGVQVNAPYLLKFKYDFEGKTEADFDERTIKCSNYDASAEVTEWSTAQCSAALDFQNGMVTCECSEANDMYVRLMSVPVDEAVICARDPTQRGCPDFCSANPNEVECITDICVIDVTARGCAGFCEANPTDPDCQPSHCDLNPQSAGCPVFCAENPEDSSCQSPPSRCFIDPNDPICTSAVAQPQFMMNKPNIERNKKLIVMLSVVLLMLVIAAASLCMLMTPRAQKGRRLCPMFGASAARTTV